MAGHPLASKAPRAKAPRDRGQKRKLGVTSVVAHRPQGSATPRLGKPPRLAVLLAAGSSVAFRTAQDMVETVATCGPASVKAIAPSAAPGTPLPGSTPNAIAAATHPAAGRAQVARSGIRPPITPPTRLIAVATTPKETGPGKGPGRTSAPKRPDPTDAPKPVLGAEDARVRERPMAGR